MADTTMDLPFVSTDIERTFEAKMGDGSAIKLKIQRPSQNQVLECDKAYRVIYSKLLRAGVLTNAEIERYLKDQKIWNEEDDKAISKLQSEIADLEKDLEGGKYGSKQEGYLKALTISNKRDEIYKITRKIGSIYDNSCESASDELRAQYLCVLTVTKEDGQPLFKDFEEFSKKANEEVTAEALRQSIIFHSRLKSRFMLDLSEQHWMLSNGFIDENGVPIIPKEEVEPAKEAQPAEPAPVIAPVV